MARWIVLVLGLLTLPASAQNINSWQGTQPFGQSYKARTSEVWVGVEPSLYVKFWDGNLVPEKGGVSATFTRTTSRSYAPSSTLLSTVTSGNPAIPAYFFGVSGPRGIFLGPASKNFVFPSEGLDSWTNYLTPTTTANTTDVTDPFGTTTAEKILPDAVGEGKVQTTSIAAASKIIVLSVYARSLTGTTTMRLAIGGSSGGTPELSTSDHVLTTTWQRFYQLKTFTAGATGNVNGYMVGQVAGEPIYVIGAQLEDVNVATYGHYRNFPGPYVPTVGAEASHNSDQLTYPSSVVGTTAGTLCVWHMPIYANTALQAGTAHTLISIGSTDLLFDYDPTSYRFRYGGTNIYAQALGFSANTWYHHCATYVLSGGNVTAHLYRGGAEVGTGATVAETEIVATPVTVGYYGNLRTHGQGLFANLRIYLSVLSAANITKIYNFEKGRFGQ